MSNNACPQYGTRRVGDKLYINNQDAYLLYNADLIDLIYPGEQIDLGADYQETPGKCSLLLISNSMPKKALQIMVYVGGADADATQRNAASLISACKRCTVRQGGSRFEYAAVLASYVDSDSGVLPYRSVTLTFGAVRRMPLVCSTLSGSGEVFNPGTDPSGVTYDITPESDLESFTINGIACKNLSAGKTFTIDGIDGKVQSDGVNRFADTDISEFPKIQPGLNTIAMSSPARVTVSFYPIL